MHGIERRVARTLDILGFSLGLVAIGCGGEGNTTDAAGGGPGFALGCDAASAPTPTASCIASFEPGKDAGFGQDKLPDIVFGEPLGSGDTSGGLDVLALGRGGTIVLGFGGNAIVDGDGPDFTVFENAFFAAGNPNDVYAELAEVSVSADGETWTSFACAVATKPPTGCAGYAPVYANADLGISAFDPAVSGGDHFDLATIGVTEARFVRIHDLEGRGAAPNAGFDLDAIAILNAKIP